MDEEDLEIDETALPPQFRAAFEQFRRRTEALEKEHQTLEKKKQTLEKKIQTLEKENQTLRIRVDNVKKDYVEFAEFCHSSILKKLVPETNRKLVTKEDPTSVHQKRHPPRLKFWQDFMDVQNVQHASLRAGLAGRKVFPSAANLYRDVRKVEDVGVRNRWTLTELMPSLVTDNVIEVIEQCRKIPAIIGRYRLGQGLIGFTSITPEQRETVNDPSYQPDLLRVYMRDSEQTTTTALVLELEPLHKVKAVALGKGLRSMDVTREVLGRTKDSIPRSEHSQYDAEKATTRLMTQLFHYMTQAGLKYGVLTTGLAYVFCMIDYREEPSDEPSHEPSHEPITLYFYLSDPVRDVDKQDGNLDYSALCQLSAFITMVLDEVSREDPSVRDRRKELAAPLNVWVSLRNGVDVSQPPEAQDRDELVRTNKKRIPLEGDVQDARRPTAWRSFSDDNYDPGAIAEKRAAQNRNRLARALARLDRKENGNTRIVSNSDIKKTAESQYCTHKCLLGLITQDVLDENCPNIHR